MFFVLSTFTFSYRRYCVQRQLVLKITHCLCTFSYIRTHCLGYHLNKIDWHTFFTQIVLYQFIVAHKFGSCGRRFAGEEFVKCGTKGIDIDGGAELAALCLITLLYGRIASRAETDVGGGFGLTVGIVVLAQSKVYQENVAIACTTHDVAGLEVEVEHVVCLMHIDERIGHSLDDVGGLIGTYRARLYIIVEVLTFDVVHHIVKRSILIE
ncbi:unknown [Prevotella sp. CAG:5226]|nr:unknown [Prevotella sp. CAG:5226]